jgi:hypothetical protein
LQAEAFAGLALNAFRTAHSSDKREAGDAGGAAARRNFAALEGIRTPHCRIEERCRQSHSDLRMYRSCNVQAEVFAVGPAVDDFYAQHCSDDYGEVGKALGAAARRAFAAVEGLKASGEELSVAQVRSHAILSVVVTRCALADTSASWWAERSAAQARMPSLGSCASLELDWAVRAQSRSARASSTELLCAV